MPRRLPDRLLGTRLTAGWQRAGHRYLPVIRADLALEETYAPVLPPAVAGVPTIAVVGSQPGRDKLQSKVAPADAALWIEATSSYSRSEVRAA